MTLKYRAKCGRTIDYAPKNGRRGKKTERVLMETDVPMPGDEKPLVRPDWCDPRCLYREKPDEMNFVPGFSKGQWDGKFYTVKGYYCKFTRVD